jgi:thiol-disulfide isomerase/thioredoxin
MKAPCTAALISTFVVLTTLAGPPSKGDAFPDLKTFNLEGKLPDTAGKVVVVDFWASWCGPCKKAMPILKQLSGTYKDKPVVFLGVSLDESKSDMDEFLAKNPMPFAMVRDPKGKLAEALKIEGIPASFVIDAKGKITSMHTGLTTTLKQDYIQEIEAGLNDAASK